MTRNQQRGGAFLTSLLIVLLIFAAVIGMKLAPHYMEYFTIKNTFAKMAAAGQLEGGPSAVKEAYRLRTATDGIKAISPADLRVSNEGGRTVVSADYEVRVPLFNNISVLVHFTPSSGR